MTGESISQVMHCVARLNGRLRRVPWLVWDARRGVLARDACLTGRKIAACEAALDLMQWGALRRARLSMEASGAIWPNEYKTRFDDRGAVTGYELMRRRWP